MSDPLATNHNMMDVLAKAKVRITEQGPFGPSGRYMKIVSAGRFGGIFVTQAEHDGAEWLHASISFTDQMPVYDDLVLLHRAVFGRRRFAYQMFVPAAQHVSIHDYALHLWGRADGKNVLPDFGLGGSI